MNTVIYMFLTNAKDDTILGFLVIEEVADKKSAYAYIYRIAVYPEHRRQGFASKMLEEVINRLENENVIKKYLRRHRIWKL